MFSIPRGPAWILIDVFEGMFHSHPASIFGASQSRAAEREAEEALARMDDPHLRDDLGLPPLPLPEPEHPALTRAWNRASRYGS